MTSEGINAVYLETRNWGKAARFFRALGYELEFETDHNSGQLRNGDTPPVFIAEVPPERSTGTHIVLKVPSEAVIQDNAELELVSPFETTHYGAREATVRDPDGRLWVLQAPATSQGEAS